jgi:hypothetical protein
VAAKLATGHRRNCAQTIMKWWMVIGPSPHSDFCFEDTRESVELSDSSWSARRRERKVPATTCNTCYTCHSPTILPSSLPSITSPHFTSPHLNLRLSSSPSTTNLFRLITTLPPVLLPPTTGSSFFDLPPHAPSKPHDHLSTPSPTPHLTSSKYILTLYLCLLLSRE